MEIFSKKYTLKQQVKMKIYLFVSFYYVFTTIDAQDSSKRRKIGAIFDRKSEHLAKTFEFEVRRLSNSDKDIHLEQTHEIVECQDSFHVSNAICNLLEHNVYGILGAFQSCALSTIQSYTDTFKVPFISLSMPQQSSSSDPYQLYIRPAYIKGLLDVVQLKQWNKIFYIYETDDGLVRLQQLYQDINRRELDLDIIVKRIVSVQSCHQMLRDIYNEITKEPLRVFLDLTSDQSQEVITAIKHDPDISNNRFHFLLVDLGINDMNATVLSAGMNVSGFSLKVPEAEPWNTQSRKKKTYGDVLVEDAVLVFHRALKKLTDPVTQIRNPDDMIKCRDNERSISFRPGKRVLNAIREGEYDGKSDSENPIKFQENGWRKEFKLPLFETRMNMQIAKVGVFNPPTQLQLHEPEIQTAPRPNITNRQIVRRITTVKEDPYVMWTEQGEK